MSSDEDPVDWDLEYIKAILIDEPDHSESLGIIPEEAFSDRTVRVSCIDPDDDETLKCFEELTGYRITEKKRCSKRVFRKWLKKQKEDRFGEDGPPTGPRPEETIPGVDGLFGHWEDEPEVPYTPEELQGMFPEMIDISPPPLPSLEEIMNEEITEEEIAQLGVERKKREEEEGIPYICLTKESIIQPFMFGHKVIYIITGDDYALVLGLREDVPHAVLKVPFHILPDMIGRVREMAGIEPDAEGVQNGLIQPSKWDIPIFNNINMTLVPKQDYADIRLVLVDTDFGGSAPASPEGNSNGT